MSTSIAYLGLSSPLAYDYDWEPELGHPNPILEAPLGLFLLYDEIWFLHPHLCPYNMRDLDYVKFVSDRNDLSDFYEAAQQRSDEDILGPDAPEPTRRPWKEYGQKVQEIAPFAEYDNHGRTTADHFYPDTRYSNFVFDRFVASKLNDDVEYVANSVLTQILSPPDDDVSKQTDRVQTAEELVTRRVSDHIPSVQTPEGPYFEEIDDFRKIKTIEQFRSKMAGDVRDVDPAELEREFEHVRNRIFASETEFSNVRESEVAVVLNFIPGASEITGFAKGMKEAIEYRSRYQNYGWANFLSKAELRTSTDDRS